MPVRLKTPLHLRMCAEPCNHAVIWTLPNLASGSHRTRATTKEAERVLCSRQTTEYSTSRESGTPQERGTSGKMTMSRKIITSGNEIHLGNATHVGGKTLLPRKPGHLGNEVQPGNTEHPGKQCLWGKHSQSVGVQPVNRHCRLYRPACFLAEGMGHRLCG